MDQIITGGMTVSIVYPQIRTSADLLKSTIRIEELIPFLQQQKAEACAMVNMKLYGLLPFWHSMKKAGIHPVIGLTVRVQFTEETVLPIIIYAQTNEGYQHLLKISSSIAI
jgi:DNA polymerase-3 subunit alpha